jgi:hypothetical protein
MKLISFALAAWLLAPLAALHAANVACLKLKGAASVHVN